MRSRSLFLCAAATAAVVALPLTAQASVRTTEFIDRAMFDSTVDRTTNSFHISGATRGPLGGFLDLTVTADDGTLPTGSNVCEPAAFEAELTLSPGETLSMAVPGEVCTSFFGDALTGNAAIGRKDLEYDGTAHRKVRVVGDGLLAASVIPGLGGQASFSASVRWWEPRG
jgi:hypothetical protein